MRKTLASITLAACLAAAGTVYAGMGYSMKCQAKPEKDPKTGKLSEPCGYETHASFGGGMFFNQTTGYCRRCRKFVYVRWTHENISPETVKNRRIKVTPRPKPLGEIWDSRTGKVLTLHACPTCKGPFAEIKRPEELKRCPRCNKPGFGIDKSKPLMAID